MQITVKLTEGPVEKNNEVFVNGNRANIATVMRNRVILSADANQWRPQDFAPIARAILFGHRQ